MIDFAALFSCMAAPRYTVAGTYFKLLRNSTRAGAGPSLWRNSEAKFQPGV